MLKWKDDAPFFALNGDVGELLLLYFGSSYVDDIKTSEFIFAVQLFKQNNSWSLKTRLSSFGDTDQSPEMDAFMSELELALKNHLDFDFSEYMIHWKQVDPEFRCGVVDIIKHKGMAIR